MEAQNNSVADISNDYFLTRESSFTSGVLRTDENVCGLGQPLHELGDALRVVLGLAQGAHHGVQDTTDDSCEQFGVEGLSCTWRVGGGVGPWGSSGTSSRWRWGEDGLRGLRKEVVSCFYFLGGIRMDCSVYLFHCIV